MSFRRSLAALAFSAVFLTLGSCVERKEAGTVNADGSGNAVIDVLVAAPGQDVAAYGRNFAAQMIKHARGADAWKDIAVTAAPDGRAHVSATVYFPDISKFRLDAPFVTTFAKNADGTWTFSMHKEEAASQPATTQLSDEQVKQAIATARSNYKQQQPAMQLLLNTLKIAMTFDLPGRVTETNIFTKSGENQVSLTIDGKQVMASMDKIMDDDALLAGAIRNGTTPAESDALLMENLFGKKGEMWAKIAGPLQTLFDYKAEETAAKAGEAAAFDKAGLNMAGTPATAPGTQ